MSLPLIRIGSNLRDVHNDLDQWFADWLPQSASRRANSWIPATDVVEQDDRYVIKADLPGFKNEDINMTLHDGMLTIKGERREEKDEQNEGRLHRVERYHGTFTRRIALPEAADTERVSATNRDGVLEVTIQKRETEQPKRIEIQ